MIHLQDVEGRNYCNTHAKRYTHTHKHKQRHLQKPDKHSKAWKRTVCKRAKQAPMAFTCICLALVEKSLL